MPLFHIALLEPEIPQNAGNIGRLCLAVDARLHLIHPLGFQTDEKAVRRAGLDYWKHVDVVEHPDADTFFAWVGSRRIYPFSTRPGPAYTHISWQEDDVYLFGRESKGLPRPLLDRLGSWRIPMVGPTRSINLAAAASVVAYGALATLRADLYTDSACTP